MHIPKWAKAISAEKRGDVIVVNGKGHYAFPDRSLAYPAGSSNGRWMHLEFANADSESELLKFVGRYGPVNGTMSIGELFPVAVHSSAFKRVTVEQPIQKLWEAHSAIAPAARLIATLQSEKPTTFEMLYRLCSKLSPHIGVSHETVSGSFKSGVWSPQTMNAATKREVFLAGDYLCHLLKQFPPSLEVVGRHGVELPHYDEGGILPTLYYLLRQDFKSEVRTIGICERCRLLFVVSRKGAQFCSAECSQLKRSLDYYHSKRSNRDENKRRVNALSDQHCDGN